jgi:hypothetical protein
VILESHFFEFQKKSSTNHIHESKFKTHKNNNLFVNLCACFYVYDFVDFDNVGCQSYNVMHNIISTYFLILSKSLLFLI